MGRRETGIEHHVFNYELTNSFHSATAHCGPGHVNRLMTSPQTEVNIQPVSLRECTVRTSSYPFLAFQTEITLKIVTKIAHTRQGFLLFRHRNNPP